MESKYAYFNHLHLEASEIQRDMAWQTEKLKVSTHVRNKHTGNCKLETL